MLDKQVALRRTLMGYGLLWFNQRLPALVRIPLQKKRYE
jgi:hypothetical protein